jgi:hypothetical protein
VAEMFSALGVPDLTRDPRNMHTRGDKSPWTGMHSGAPKDVGIRVERIAATFEGNPCRNCGGRERYKNRGCVACRLQRG